MTQTRMSRKQVNLLLTVVGRHTLASVSLPSTHLGCQRLRKLLPPHPLQPRHLDRRGLVSPRRNSGAQREHGPFSERREVRGDAVFAAAAAVAVAVAVGCAVESSPRVRIDREQPSNALEER